jgi:hypothetical protein
VKRVLATLAVLACAPQNDVAPADAGKPDAPAPVILLKVIDEPIVVLPGSSTTVRVEVSDPSGFGPLTLGTAPLPSGLSATSASWQNGDATTLSLTFTATSDASDTEIPIAIRAVANGKIVATTTVLLDVSGPVGVIDTSYGDDGCLFLPNGSSQPSDLRVLADGTIVVAGLDAGHLFVDRVAPDGTASKSTFDASTIYLVTAIADDGHVAFSTFDINGSTVYEMTTSGAASSVAHFAEVNALAWDGDALFVGTTNGVSRVSADTSTADATVSFSVHTLETLAANRVVVAGSGNKDTIMTTLVFDGSSLSTWSADVTVAQQEFPSNTVTTSSGTYVGVVGNEVGAILVSYGTIIDSFLTGAIGNEAHIAVPPNGKPLVFGTISSLMTSTTGVVQTPSIPFGGAGHAYVRFGADTTLAAGALDATASYLYVTGNVVTQIGLRGYIARVRLTSTP